MRTMLGPRRRLRLSRGRCCYNGHDADVLMLRRARCPRASQALLYPCAVSFVPGPAAVVALPAATSRLVATNPECVRRLKGQRVSEVRSAAWQAPEAPPQLGSSSASTSTSPRRPEARPEQAGGPLSLWGRWVGRMGHNGGCREPRPLLACGVAARQPLGTSRGKAAGQAASLGSSLAARDPQHGHTR